MHMTYKKFQKMPSYFLAEGIKAVPVGGFVVLAMPKQIKCNLLVGADYHLQYDDTFEEIKTFKVESSTKKGLHLSLVNDADFTVSARAHDRRPVYITGAQALHKQMLGYH